MVGIIPERGGFLHMSPRWNSRQKAALQTLRRTQQLTPHQKQLPHPAAALAPENAGTNTAEKKDPNGVRVTLIVEKALFALHHDLGTNRAQRGLIRGGQALHRQIRAGVHDFAGTPYLANAV